MLASPLVARAQQVQRVRRVGVLMLGAEADLDSTQIRRLLRDELQKHGWTEGHNLRLDFRFGNADATQARIFAADLVELAPDVIVTVYLLAPRALQQETKTIPIIFAGPLNSER